MRFVVDKMILGEFVFPVVELSDAIIAPVILQYCSSNAQYSFILKVSLHKQTNWRNQESFQQNLEIECNIRREVYRSSLSGILRSTQNKYCHTFFNWSRMN